MSKPPPPIAPTKPHQHEAHGERWDDPWHWLRDPKYPEVEDEEVLDYLKSENAFFEAWKGEHRPLLDTLFEEMKGRIKEDDSSVPIKDGEWLTWWAYKPGEQYKQWWRRLVAGGADELFYDEAAEAEGRDYFRLGSIEISPDNRLLATLADYDGAERFELRIRDLATGKDIETVTKVGIGDPIWSSDSKGVAYTEVNDQWRSYRALYHRLGKDPAKAHVLYEEKDDPGFMVGLDDSQDRSTIFVATGDNATSEVRFVGADDPTRPLTLISPRQANREYHVDAAHGKLWILTNDDHINFRLAEADLAAPGEWRTVIAGSDDTYLTDVAPYCDYMAVTRRIDGLDRLSLRSYDGDETPIAFGEAAYSAYFGGNPDFAPDSIRVGYSSMVTPASVFDYHPKSGELELKKVQEVPSGFDGSQYATERLMIEARDGVRVPVSVVYKKGFEKNGEGRLFLYAYGAYGISIAPGFNTNRISLLDRGWACAIAHIRGGDDLGHGWFLDGKLTKRMNSFNDFIDVAKGLCDAGFSKPGRIAINGGSAGGKLMGAVANMAPELWGAVVADVPFVDVLATMLDETLPLTPGEWPEWGNPIVDKAAFDLIKSYSPYDNVVAQDYPPMLITGGLTDPRVTYWEPAKWAAKLRARKTDDNLLLLKINMGAGHAGKSGRWEGLHEVAETYAFVLTENTPPLPPAGEGWGEGG